jgi:hypothetical protein
MYNYLKALKINKYMAGMEIAQINGVMKVILR